MEKVTMAHGIALVNALNIKEGDNIVEVGCGTGRLACFLINTL
jgi:ubiquinone/menaquinone biosynthesis C-methylase UbiE